MKQIILALVMLSLFIVSVPGQTCPPSSTRVGDPAFGGTCPSNRAGFVTKDELYFVWIVNSIGAQQINVYGNGPCFPQGGCCSTGNIQSCYPEFYLSFTRDRYWEKDVGNKYIDTASCSNNCPDAAIGSCHEASRTPFILQFVSCDDNTLAGGGGESEQCIAYWSGEFYCGTAANFTANPSTGCSSTYYL